MKQIILYTGPKAYHFEGNHILDYFITYFNTQKHTLICKYAHNTNDYCFSKCDKWGFINFA